jgi:hypothetical protein
MYVNSSAGAHLPNKRLEIPSHHKQALFAAKRQEVQAAFKVSTLTPEKTSHFKGSFSDNEHYR